MTEFNHSGRYLSVQYVPLSQVRPNLTELLTLIREHGFKMRLMRHGKPVATLISNSDFRRLQDATDLALLGPIHPVTGKAMGIEWVKENGWTPGMAFQWTKTGAVVSDAVVPNTGAGDSPALRQTGEAIAENVLAMVSGASKRDAPETKAAPTPAPRKKRWFWGRG